MRITATLASVMILTPLCGAAAAQALPAPVEWPDTIPLKEEVVAYTPVSTQGSIVRGAMYGGTQIEDDNAYAWLPDGLAENQRLCFRIESRDGAYTGSGRISGPVDAGTQLAFKLNGPELRKLRRKHPTTAMRAWVIDTDDCDASTIETLIPVSWSVSDADPALTIYANSTGYQGRLAVRDARTQKYSTIACQRIADGEGSRVYDIECKVPICRLARSDRALLEIRNRSQRVHLERLSLASLRAACPQTGE